MSDETTGRLPITAAVLAGGRSMRMGVDKTLLPVDGEALVAMAVEAARGICEETVVVTNRPDDIVAAGLPDAVPVLTDEVAYQGPLGGLATALASARTEWVLALAADMPWIEPALVRALWEARDGGQVVLPVGERGPEPLLALYRTDCLPAVRRALETGRRRLVAIFPEVRVVEVPAEQLRSADPDLRSLVNVNTPADLAEVREAAEAEARHEPRAVRVRPAALAEARSLPSERPVTIHMNDVEVATVQATPNDIEELGVGFLLAEGLISDREAFASVSADHKRGLVWVVTAESVPDDMVYKRRYVTSGCGKGITFSSIGHARGLARVESAVVVEGAEILELMVEMSRLALGYRDTGGMHACGLRPKEGPLLVREDVGRHNALDKLLGRAWLDRIPTEDAVLLSTGRISYEMAVKAAKSRVPIVASRSAVTDLAAEIADELGITIVAYARGGKLTVHTHPERISVSGEGAE